MKAFAAVLAVLSALSLVPLALLVRATRQIVPGKGPQGGEAIFLFWFLMLAWTWVVASAAFVSTGLVVGSSPLVRWVLWPAASLVGVTAWVVVAFAFLANGADPPAGATRMGAGVPLAGWLTGILLVGSQAVHLLAVRSRP